MCGWLKDRYGLSWQIVPAALASCSATRTRSGPERAMEAMLTMRKIDIDAIRAAADG